MNWISKAHGRLYRMRQAVGDWTPDILAPGSARMLWHDAVRSLSPGPQPQPTIPRSPSAAPSADGTRAPRAEPVVLPDGDAIPPNIFQTWKTRDNLPSNYAYWSSTFSSLNPGHRHLIWDDYDNRDFVTQEFRWFLPYYDAYPKEIFRADIVRYLFLFKYGGLYVDMDTECLRPVQLDSYRGGIVLARMGQDTEFPHSIPNAIMASSPNQLFWLLVVAMAIELVELHSSLGDMADQRPEKMTGPVLVKSAYDFYMVSRGESAVTKRAARVTKHVGDGALHGQAVLLSPETWYPIDWHNRVHAAFYKRFHARRELLTPAACRKLFPKSELVTYWTHSWE